MVSPSGSRQAVARESPLHTIIRGEVLEMPGLMLTLRQGARLWNVNVAACERAFDSLVDAGFLVKRGDAYVRSDSGRRCA